MNAHEFIQSLESLANELAYFTVNHSKVSSKVAVQVRTIVRDTVLSADAQNEFGQVVLLNQREFFEAMTNTPTGESIINLGDVTRLAILTRSAVEAQSDDPQTVKNATATINMALRRLVEKETEGAVRASLRKDGSIRFFKVEQESGPTKVRKDAYREFDKNPCDETLTKLRNALEAEAVYRKTSGKVRQDDGLALYGGRPVAKSESHGLRVN